MMKNIKFILFAVIVGIFMANTAFASDEDDFYTLIDKCCDYYGYEDYVNQDVKNLWQYVSDMSYLYCFHPETYSDLPFASDDVICLRFSDSLVYPSVSSYGAVSYGYFMTFDSYSPVSYCNIYFTHNSVYYDMGIANNLTSNFDNTYGTYYIGEYSKNYHNIYNSYELVRIDNFVYNDYLVFCKNYDTFMSYETMQGHKPFEILDSLRLFDYHYFMNVYDYFKVGDNIYCTDDTLGLYFDMDNFGYSFPSGNFNIKVCFYDKNGDFAMRTFGNSDLNSSNDLEIHDDSFRDLVFVIYIYNYNDTYVYQFYNALSDWFDYQNNGEPITFDNEYDDIVEDLPFESNSPDDLDLPYNEISDVQNEIIDYIGFENDLAMLKSINQLDFSNVDNKETALMLKFVGYELFIVRVSLSVLVVCLITGFAWKNFGNMYEKIKKGRSNL